MKLLGVLALWVTLASNVAFADHDEGERYIQGTCKITGIRNVAQATVATWTDRCVLETPALPYGFNNYYRVIVHLSGDSPIATDIGDIHDFIKARNSDLGEGTLTSLLWGSIVIFPDSTSIRAALASRAADLTSPAIEIRPQTIRISRLDDRLEILFFELWEDFNGKTPLDAWMARYMESFRKLSHSR